MSDPPRIDEWELHAFLDGELSDARSAEIAALIDTHPPLAERVAAFASDRQRLSQAFAPLADRPLPPRWEARIGQAAPARRRVPRIWLAVAASVLLLVGAGTWFSSAPKTDPILLQAARARAGAWAPGPSYAGPALPPADVQTALLRATLGLHVRVPDLGRFGYRLAALQLYRDRAGRAAGLRYRNEAGHELTLFLRASDGSARFDLLRQGRLRICLWQDDVVAAVLTGEMTAGEMMRVASLAYVELNG